MIITIIEIMKYDVQLFSKNVSNSPAQIGPEAAHKKRKELFIEI